MGRDNWQTWLEPFRTIYLLWTTHFEWICDLSDGSSSFGLSAGSQFELESEPCSEKPGASRFSRNVNKTPLFWPPHGVAVLTEPFSWEGSVCFFLQVLTPIFLPTVATFWLQIINLLFHQTATFRSGITLINANMGQDHFQEHQVQVFAAVTNTKTDSKWALTKIQAAIATQRWCNQFESTKCFLTSQANWNATGMNQTVIAGSYKEKPLLQCGPLCAEDT